MSGGEGGSSRSSTATTTATTNTDKRLVVDGASIGISADGGSTITVNSTDAGAIKGAGAVALAALSTNATNFDHLIAASQSLFAQQQNALTANQQLTGELANTAQTAYADAANQASGNKQLILAALAVVAVVGFASIPH